MRNFYGLTVVLNFVLASCSFATLPPADIKFPEGKDVVEIPFTRDRGWIILKVRVNDSKELSFMLDSGAPIGILVDEKLAHEIKLNMHGSVSVKGTDGNAPKSVPLANEVRFNLNGIEITNGLMAIGATTSAVDGIDGIIGKYLFESAVVRVDWEHSKLVVTNASKFTYHGKGEVLPVTSENNGHYSTDVNIESNGKIITSKADIDVGNISSYFFIDKSSGASPNEKGRKITNIITGWGANGPAFGSVARTNLKMGTIHLDSVVTVFNDIQSNEEINANIGINLLERFEVIFDYPHHQLILERNESFAKPFTYNQSGIILNPVRGHDYVVIAGIIPGSSANEEGLKAGDKIYSINGRKISELTRSEVKDLIQGKTVIDIDVEVMKDGNLSAKKIKMKRLI